MGKAEVPLDASGYGEVTYTVAGWEGKRPGVGAYWAMADGGGVKDKKLLFVVKGK